MPTRPSRISTAALLSALPDFAFAAVCLITWIAPATFGVRMIRSIMLVMLVEFIVVHSAAFMGQVAFGPGARRKRARGIVALGVLYTLFVGGFALAFRTWWPIAAFWVLTLNRMLGVLLGDAPTGEEKQYVQRGWAAGALFYLLGVMLTALLPVPALGITRDVVAAQEFSVTGLWISEPARAVAFGFLYFGIFGFSELFSHRWAASGVAQARGRRSRKSGRH